ncbi:TcpE family conjugal transfer membrane protein [Streptosporangium sp. NPDC004631]
MDLPTYTNIWRIEKRLYKLYDLRLPTPLPIVWIGVFVGVVAPWSLLLAFLGLPFDAPWHVLYLVPPGIVTWLSTRPVIESKRLTELLQSQVRYVGEPRTWCRMAPAAEPSEITLAGRVWRAAPEPVAETRGKVAGKVGRRAWYGQAGRAAAPSGEVRPAVAAAVAVAAAPTVRERARGTAPASRRGAAPALGRSVAAEMSRGAAFTGPAKAPVPSAGSVPPPSAEFVPPLSAGSVPPSSAGSVAPASAGSASSAAPVISASAVPADRDPAPGASTPAVPATRPDPDPAGSAPGAPGPSAAVPSAAAPRTSVPRTAAVPAETEASASAASKAPDAPIGTEALRRLRRLAASAEVERATSFRAEPIAPPAPSRAPRISGTSKAPGDAGAPGTAVPPPPARRSDGPDPAERSSAPRFVGPAPAGRRAAEPVEREADSSPRDIPAAEVPADVQPEDTPPGDASRDVPVSDVPSSDSRAADVPVGGVSPGDAPVGEVPATVEEDARAQHRRGQPAPAAQFAEQRRARPQERPTGTPAGVSIRAVSSGPVTPDPVAPAVPVPRPAQAETRVRRVESVVGRDSAGGWRRLAQVVIGPGGGSRTDGSELDEARARALFSGSRRVVVLGCTGGAGQTTTALMLGHTLARYREDRVLAVDASTGAHALSRRIEAESPETLTSLLAGLDNVHGYLGMRAYTSRCASGLEVVAGDADSGAEQRLSDRTLFSDRRLGRTMDILDRHYRLVVVDPAAALAARVLPYADQLVLVVPASEDGPDAVAMTYEWLDGHGCADLRRRAVLVVNGVSRRSMGDVEQAEAVARGRCRAIVRVPWEDELAPGRSERVEPSHLRAPGRRAYLALAGVVVAGFGAVQAVRPSEEEVAQ